MPPFPIRRGLAISCVAAVTIPVAFFVLARKTRRGAAQNDGSTFSSLSVEQWTLAHVAAWLRSLGTSPATVSVFLSNEMDGPALLLLEEQHLVSLAPKLRDLLIIRDGIRRLRESAAPDQSELSDEERDAKAFVEGMGAIQLALTSREYMEASLTVRRAARAESVIAFRRLLPLFRALPPHVQLLHMSLVEKIQSHLEEGAIEEEDEKKKETKVGNQMKQVNNNSNEAPTNLSEQLSTLHGMVDGFLHLLNSTDQRVITDPQLQSLRHRITEQIQEVMEVAARLPRPYGEALHEKCALVLRRIASKPPQQGKTSEKETGSHSHASPNGNAPHHPTPNGSMSGSTNMSTNDSTTETIQFATVVRRLREVFSTLKSSNVVSAPPAERLRHFSALLQEVQAMESSAAAWPDRRASAVVGQVASNVSGVLQQMISLTRDEMAAEDGGAEERADNADDEPTENEQNGGTNSDDAAAVMLPAIVRSLQAALQLLHSREFATAPPGEQEGAVRQITQILAVSRQRIAGLPLTEATATVATMIERAQDIVSSLPGGAGVINEEDEETEENETNAPNGNPLDAAWRDGALEAAVSELEEVFDFINSARFTSLQPTERMTAAQAQLERLTSIQQRITQCGGDEELRELVQPLREILLIEAGQGHLPQRQQEPQQQQQQQQQQPPQRRERQQERSPAMGAGSGARLIAQLEAILGVVQSSEFLSASPLQRQQIARELIRRLDELESNCQTVGEPASALLPVLRRLRGQLAALVDEPMTHGKPTNRAVNTNSIVPEVEGDDNLQDETNAGEENAMSTASLIARMQMLRARLQNAKSPSDLIPLMEALERGLSDADASGVDWRSDERAVTVVGTTLEELQTAQQRMTGRSSELCRVLLEACEELRSSPPDVMEGLRPYVELLENMRDRLDNIPQDASEAYQALQRTVVEVSREIRASSQEEQQRRAAAPPPPPPSRTTTTISTAATSNSRNSHVAEVLLDVSDRLRESNVPNELLDRYDNLLDSVAALSEDPAAVEAVGSIREQIRLQRLLNGDTDDASSESDDEEDDADDEKDDKDDDHRNGNVDEEDVSDACGSDAVDGADDDGLESDDERMNADMETSTDQLKPLTTPCANEEDKPCANGSGASEKETTEDVPCHLSDAGVPEAERSELFILPRIERRLALPAHEFAARTTLFDVRSMSATLLHLAQSPLVQSTPALSERVGRVKVALAQQLEAFHSQGTAEPPGGVAALRVVSGSPSPTALTLCAGEECVGGAEWTPSPRTAPPPPPDAWRGRSTAILVADAADVASTVRVELDRLRETLVRRYAFDVLVLLSSSARAVLRLIHAESANAARLLVYYHATAAGEAAAAFPDGSSLSHADAVRAAGGVERVVVVHASPAELTVCAALFGEAESVSLRATDAALAELRPLRCWMYDGLITPVMEELLAREAQTVLCPEDLITFAATTLTAAPTVLGAVEERKAAGMAFFVPLDPTE